MLQSDETMGAFIFIILDVKIIIANSTFLNGLAKYGGAIYSSGQSEIIIQNSLISSNMAKLYGGAIFANGFKSIRIE
jgi:predicted outer membrane repeat protein